MIASIRIINIILSVLILLLLNTFVLAETDKTTGVSNWQTRCEELKKNQDPNSSLNIVFSEKPKISAVIPHWLLSWNGIDVPLPIIAFHEIYVKKGYDNQFEVMMIAKDEFIMNALVFENKPFIGSLEESQAQNDGDGPTKSQTAARKERTIVRISDNILLGYQITPADLICMERDRTEEMAKVDALIMKGIGRTGELISAYKDTGIYRGWIEMEKSDKHKTYIVNILTGSNDNVWYQINFIIPHNSRYHDVPFLIGNNRQKDISPSPDWLVALNAAMTSKSNDLWQRYATLARKAGISEKSIARVLKNQSFEKRH